MLSQLLAKRAAINHMYGNMEDMRHLRDRNPSSAEWSIANAIVEVLDFPCKLVMKSQAKGECPNVF